MSKKVFPFSRDFEKQWNDALDSAVDFEHLKLMITLPSYKERFNLVNRAEVWILERIYNEPSLMEIIN